ncbi:hypothetical protein P154DRAFT_294097 [Amniculicola lignicola CBS 123094]|uniref:Uncharacterized protein n=1 Tax=Amniculicola lignicola CBS 123094 TaxID=1392246 RepID=A0A6A5WHY5_9PLEO|nr:hypothetical protein P154DRAFT_294097 [Amniculicola lignicola CBS 123094]
MRMRMAMELRSAMAAGVLQRGNPAMRTGPRACRRPILTRPQHSAGAFSTRAVGGGQGGGTWELAGSSPSWSPWDLLLARRVWRIDPSQPTESGRPPGPIAARIALAHRCTQSITSTARVCTPGTPGTPAGFSFSCIALLRRIPVWRAVAAALTGQWQRCLPTRHIKTPKRLLAPIRVLT